MSCESVSTSVVVVMLLSGSGLHALQMLRRAALFSNGADVTRRVMAGPAQGTGR